MSSDPSKQPPTVPNDFDDEGVDLALVRYSLSLSPTERLKSVENFMKTMATVRKPATAPPRK